MPAQTIQIYLPFGEPRGLRIAELTTRIVQAIQVPRARMEQFFARPECGSIGLYFLFGPNPDGSSPLAYIGQTEDLRSRLSKHHSDREFWRTAVVIVSRTQSFTQAHLRYLEFLSIQKAGETGRYLLENGNAGSKPFVPEPMQADVIDAFETVEVLLATLGFPIFEPLQDTRSNNPAELLHCRGPKAEATGKLVTDGLLVLAGSTAWKEFTASSGLWIRQIHGELLRTGVLEDQGDSLRFTRDHLFESPSAAAGAVLARNANGWQEWRDQSGRTIHDLYRAESA